MTRSVVVVVVVVVVASVAAVSSIGRASIHCQAATIAITMAPIATTPRSSARRSPMAGHS